MTATRRRVLSLAAAVGMLGGSIAGWTAGDDATPAAAATTEQASGTPDGTTRLDARVSALLAQERVVRRALERAKAQLERRIADGETSLADLRNRVAATQALLRQEQARLAAARSAPTPIRIQTQPPTETVERDVRDDGQYEDEHEDDDHSGHDDSRDDDGHDDD